MNIIWWALGLVAVLVLLPAIATTRRPTMNLWTAAFLVFLTVFGAFGYTIYLATQGNLIAVFVVAVVFELAHYVVFKTFDIIYDRLRDKAEANRVSQSNLRSWKESFQVQQAQIKALAAGQRLNPQVQQPQDLVDVDPSLFEVEDNNVDLV